jgi:hypothetical protein
MADSNWIAGHWQEIIESTGIIGGLFFNGLSLRIDARVRRAGTIVEITKQHRELWAYFEERPNLSPLFDRKRDLTVHPLADDEVHFVNLVLNHLRATFYAATAHIFIQPECLSEDIRDFLSYPGPLAAWKRLRPMHDQKFVAFIERNRAPVTP